MKKCIICNSEIDDSVSKCPYCQGEQKEYDNDIFNMNSSKTSSQVKRKKELLNEAETFKLFEYEKNIDSTYSIIKLKNNNIYNVNIPEGVVAINNNAFENSKVMEVVLPEGLIELGDGAFKNCANLEKVNIPSTLKFIGNETFLDCPLLDIVIPTTVIRKGNNFLKGTLAEKRINEQKKLAEEQARLAKEKRDAEIKRQEEARLAKLKAEEEARKKEQERQARIKAEEEAKQKAIEEERKKEQERLAKIKAEEEAKRQEEARLAKEKRDAEIKKQEEEAKRIAAEQEAIRKHEEKLREARRLAAEQEEKARAALKLQEIKNQQDLKEAQNIDNDILNLSNAYKSGFWCNDVINLYKRVNDNYDVRLKCKNLHILENIYKEALHILEISKIDAKIKELNSKSYYDKDWCNKVINMYHDVSSYKSELQYGNLYLELYEKAKNRKAEIEQDEKKQLAAKREAEYLRTIEQQRLAKIKAEEEAKRLQAEEKKAKRKQKLINACLIAVHVILFGAALILGIIKSNILIECLIACGGLVYSLIWNVIVKKQFVNNIYLTSSIILFIVCAVLIIIQKDVKTYAIVVGAIGLVVSICLALKWHKNCIATVNSNDPTLNFADMNLPFFLSPIFASVISVAVGMMFSGWTTTLIIGISLLVIWGIYAILECFILNYLVFKFDLILAIIFCLAGIVLCFISRQLWVLSFFLIVIAIMLFAVDENSVYVVILLFVLVGVFVVGSYRHGFKDFNILDGVLIAYNGREEEVVIPDGVKEININAFKRSSRIRTIILPDTLRKIDNFAFDKCKKLKNVYVSSMEAWCNISFEGEYANPLKFADNLYVNNELVTELVIPDTITEIKPYAFYGYQIENIVFSDNVTVIGEYAFAENDIIKNIKLPEKLVTLGDRAFYGCNLLENVYFGSEIKTIGESVFRDNNLLEITYNGTEDMWINQVDKYSDSSFWNDKKPWDHEQKNYKMKYLK